MKENVRYANMRKKVDGFVEGLESGRVVLFEDNRLIVVDKPWGLASIPERNPDGTDILTLISSVKKEKFYVVHRLDKDVSGVIVFAKDPETHRQLNRMFALRKVRKVYIALTHGLISVKRGMINLPIRPFGSGRMGIDHERGKPSTTYFKLIKGCENCSLVAVLPETGRRHQIRVHLYSIGHPIVGDPLYGKKDLREIELMRLCLHAHSLAIKREEGIISFCSSIPEDFCYIIKTLKCVPLTTLGDEPWERDF